MHREKKDSVFYANCGVLDDNCPWCCKNILNTSGFASKGTNMVLNERVSALSTSFFESIWPGTETPPVCICALPVLVTSVRADPAAERCDKTIFKNTHNGFATLRNNMQKQTHRKSSNTLYAQATCPERIRSARPRLLPPRTVWVMHSEKERSWTPLWLLAGGYVGKPFISLRYH